MPGTEGVKPGLLGLPSLMLGLLEQFLVLVFAHLLLTPLNNVTHTLTSFLNDSLVVNSK
jgi:hypothetical protein